jgi:hypothetical protein
VVEEALRSHRHHQKKTWVDITHRDFAFGLKMSLRSFAESPRRCGVVLGAAVFSHWLLDLIVHRGDMTILPGNVGNLPKLGFGLWQAPAAALTMELALVAAGAFFYWRAALTAVRAADGASRLRADIAASLVLISGCAILFLDATG